MRWWICRVPWQATRHRWAEDRNSNRPLQVESSYRRPREADVRARLGDLATSNVGSAPRSDVHYRDAVVTSTTAKCRRPSVQGAAVTVRNRCVAVIGQGAERSNEGVGGQARSPFLRLRPFLRDWFEAVRRLRTKETPRVVIGLWRKWTENRRGPVLLAR